MFFKAIDPTSLNRQGHDEGTRYRTGVYYVSNDQLPIIEEVFNEQALRQKIEKAKYWDRVDMPVLDDNWFVMGGLLKHIDSLCALTNPSTNSFKRLVPGFEAPVTVGYATSNRSAVIRIPAYAKTPNMRRFELRNPDATCNPYFAYAAILMAGLDGVKKKIDPHKNGWGPFDVNLYKLPEEEKAKLKGLPTSLDKALDALEADHAYLTEGGVFPEELIRNFIQIKRAECAEIAKIPTVPEYDRYFNC